MDPIVGELLGLVQIARALQRVCGVFSGLLSETGLKVLIDATGNCECDGFVRVVFCCLVPPIRSFTLPDMAASRTLVGIPSSRAFSTMPRTTSRSSPDLTARAVDFAALAKRANDARVGSCLSTNGFLPA